MATLREYQLAYIRAGYVAREKRSADSLRAYADAAERLASQLPSWHPDVESLMSRADWARKQAEIPIA